MSPVFFAFVDRQKAYDVIEAVTGFRMHPAWYRIGGLAHDLPQGWDRLVREFVDYLPARLDEYQKVALENSIVVSSEEHTSELQSLLRISYAVLCLKKKIRHLHKTDDQARNEAHRPPLQ